MCKKYEELLKLITHRYFSCQSATKISHNGGEAINYVANLDV